MSLSNQMPAILRTCSKVSCIVHPLCLIPFLHAKLEGQVSQRPYLGWGDGVELLRVAIEDRLFLVGGQGLHFKQFLNLSANAS